MADPPEATGAAPAAELRLNCRPGKSGANLIFLYTIENRGPADVYVMHASPGIDPQTRAERANEQSAVIIWAPGGEAIIGKFIAPMPTDRRVALPVIPLARLLRAGASFDGVIEVPTPLAETSPYFADLTLRQYEVVDIKGVEFRIGYWPAASERMMAEPCRHASELFEIGMRDPVRAARRISQHFPTTGLQLFKRKDAFPRSLD